MVTWDNLDTLASFQNLSKTGRIDLKKVMSGENGAERVKNYSIPMAEGLVYNYAAKQVDDDVLEALVKLAEEAQLSEKFEELYNGAVINTGENRLVLHQLTRGQLGKAVVADGVDKRKFYVEQQQRIADFANKVHAGEITNAAGEKFTVNYVERTKDDTFLLVADGKKQNVSYTMKGDQVTFSFADDTINGTWTGDQLLAADGSPVGWDEMQIIAGNEKPVISDETYSNALGHILYGNLESISFWGFTVLGVLIYVLGIVQIYYPDKVYFFLRRWQFQNAELSDEGRTVTVIGGVIICIIGIGVMSGLILYLIK